MLYQCPCLSACFDETSLGRYCANKRYHTRLLCIKLKFATQNLQREKERMKARGTKAKNVAAQHFPHCLFMNYSSTEPPTPHHFGRNSSQTGTYLWIGSCQREIPLTVKKGKKRNPTECVLIHHSKAIGFKTEAVRL